MKYFGPLEKCFRDQEYPNDQKNVSGSKQNCEYSYVCTYREITGQKKNICEDSGKCG